MKALIARWTSGPGFWSLADQAVVSAGNFVTTILLARALSPSEYGVYALLFAVMLFMVSSYSAIVAYGLSLHGSTLTDAALRPLAGGSLVLTAWMGVALGAATSIVTLFFGRGSLAPWIVLALLFWQLQETTRRALMSRLRHRDATWGDAVSYLGQAGCIAYLLVDRRLTLASAFEVMAMTSAAAMLFQAWQLRLALSDLRGPLRVLRKYWDVGRSALLANATQAFVGQMLLWLLGIGGIAEVACFQSLTNLLRVTNPVMFAIGSVLLPRVAACGGASTEGLRVSRRYGLIGAVILLPYFLAIFVFPSALLRLLYGAGSVYAGFGAELRVLVVGSAFAYAAYVLGMHFYALSMSNVVLRSALIAAAIGVVGGLILIMEAGILGAAIAYGLIFLGQTVVLGWYLRRYGSSPVAEPMRVAGP
jgi:O-antigen/teichoic acid export membrane protein